MNLKLLMEYSVSINSNITLVSIKKNWTWKKLNKSLNFQVRFEKVNFFFRYLRLSSLQIHVNVHSRPVSLRRLYSRELSCHCRSEVSRLFLLLRASACRRRSATVNERPTTKGGSEGKKRRKRSAVCTRVIRKRQPPRAAWALSSKNKQNVAPRHGLTRVYIARIADIAGRFSLVLSFSLAVIPFHFLLF